MSPRNNLEKRNHQFYQPLPWGVGGVCTYCGMPADTVDHVPPLASVEMVEGDKYLVPACRECNSTLGASPLLTIEARASHLIAAFAVKYKSLLATPEWEEHELDEMGRGLRDSIRMAIRHKEIVLERLRSLQETIDG